MNLPTLLLRQGGVCDMAQVDDNTQDARVEAFCNSVAGNVLVPASALLEDLLPRSRRTQSGHWKSLREIAQTVFREPLRHHSPSAGPIGRTSQKHTIARSAADLKTE
jgi:hypothetical protein